MRNLFFTIILFVLLICAVAAAGEAAEGGTEQGVFSGTLADAVWTVIVFAILLVVLGKFAWKPIIGGLKLRQEHIQQQIETAETIKQQAEKLLEEHQQQALQIITGATKQAQKEAEALTEKARQEVQEIRHRAQEDIKHARIAASEQLWKEAGDIVVALGSEVLERTITPQDNQQLINNAILKLRQKKNE